MSLFGMPIGSVPEGTKLAADTDASGTPLESMESAGSLDMSTPVQNDPASTADVGLLKAIGDFVDGKTAAPPDLSQTQDPTIRRLVGEQTQAAPTASPAAPAAPTDKPAEPPPLDPNVAAMMQQNQALMQQMAAMQQQVVQTQQQAMTPQPRAPTIHEKAQAMEAMGLDPTQPANHVTYDSIMARHQMSQEVEQLKGQLAHFQHAQYQAQVDAAATQHVQAAVSAEFKDLQVPPATLENIRAQAASWMQAGHSPAHAVHYAMEGYRPLLQQMAKSQARAPTPTKQAPPAAVAAMHPGLLPFMNNPQFQGMTPEQIGAIYQAAGAPSLQGAGAGRHAQKMTIEQADGVFFS